MNRLLALAASSFIIFFSLLSTTWAADSTSTTNIVPTSTQPRYATQWTNNLPNTMYDWTTLPACPGTPGSSLQVAYCPGINTASSSHVNPIDPNSSLTGSNFIYGSQLTYTGSTQTASGTVCLSTSGSGCSNVSTTLNQNVYCPDLCLSRRTVNNTLTTSTTVPTVITSVVFPMCPSGYAKVAEYDIQPEIAKATAVYTFDSPITWANYQSIQSITGHSCTLDARTATNSVTVRSCNYGNSGDMSTWRSINSSPGWGATASINGYAGQYWDKYQSDGTYSTTYTATNSSGWDASNSTSTLYSGYVYYCSAGLCSCQNFVAGWPDLNNSGYQNLNYTGWVEYGYTYFSCTVPSGTYVQTTNTTATVYVCSHIQDKWENSR